MARLPRICPPGIPQHIIQRGNNRQACFGSEEDFAAYLHWLDEYSVKYGVCVHAWVLMTNHVHLLLTPSSPDGVSMLMQTLGRHYVRYFNHTYRRSGTLWEGRFKSCVIDAEAYLLLCQRYVELNPVRAGMVLHPGDYRWSSFQANGYGKEIKLWTPHAIYQSLGKSPGERASAYRALFVGQLDEPVISEIRDSVNKCMALGNDRFKKEIELLTGRRVMAKRRGPKVKSKEMEFLL